MFGSSTYRLGMRNYQVNDLPSSEEITDLFYATYSGFFDRFSNIGWYLSGGSSLIPSPFDDSSSYYSGSTDTFIQ